MNSIDRMTAEFPWPETLAPGWLRFGWEDPAALRYRQDAEQRPRDQPPAARPASAAATLPRGRGEIVLVVDDEAPIRGVLTQMLERNGYRVLTARNGAEAVSIYAQRTAEIAVVLTDMMMPIMDGPATARAIREINPQAKLVGMSGARIGPSKSAEVELPHFIPKPYTTETVLQTLSRVLRGE